jgi:cation diffusion facilitator CzcD-associated flavoprotein CzcO
MPFDTQAKPERSESSSSENGTPQIVIIGTGFAGLGMAIELRKAGIEDFVILEKAEDVGGTWRDNHYPGCACDVQSHLYSFSFEANPDWSRMFSPQPEIWDYLRHCTRKYDLLPKIRFNQQVVGASYNEDSGLWDVKVCDGKAIAEYMRARGLKPGETIDPTDPALPPTQSLRARVIVSGMGGLSVPAYPKLKGLENFAGESFHSQDWKHEYGLAGKRVAVIGTGASAIQFVPQIQPKVIRLDLYQRTPPWIMPKPDREITRFERWLFKHLPITQRLFRGAIYTLLEFRALAFVVHPKLMHQIKRLARLHIHRQIKDPVLRKKVTPDYMLGCKRVLISDDYYPALAQPNVDVITSGIREVRAHSIVTEDGQEREIDCIIFGTGFHATDPLPRGAIFGRGGQDILDAWKEGPEAFRGTTISGFPNLFLLAGPNTGLGHSSMVYMIESQIRYVRDAIRLMRDKKLKAVDVQPEAQARYNQELQQDLKQAIWSVGGCRSWYLLPNGKNVTLWPRFTWQFRRQLRKFDAAAYRLEPRQAAAPVADLQATRD